MKASKFSGRAEGVHFEAGWGRDAGGGDLRQGSYQPGEVLQQKDEVRRAAAARDEAAEAA